ncbi:cytoskeleton-associated protein 2 isoform X3 [Vulpes vulpes]|uniref:Cytoskeleton-associated protein 2 isoform X3 n=1 Tax=Vulpes vulpes TaxID=9627 RepID=A0ABM4XDU1_VULVU
MLQRKTFFAYKQENHISSSTGQKVMNSEGQIQEETKVLKFKTKMAGEENVSRLLVNKNNITMGENCIPLRPSNELANLTMITDTHNLEDNNHTRQSVPIEDGPQSQRMTLSQMFHLKNNSKKKQISTEKPKQDANMPKKLVLGSYNGQIVKSKINSFRKPLPARDESSVATKKLSATIPKAPEPLPADTSSLTVRSHRAPNVMTTTRPVNTASQDRRLVRPPIRSHCNSAQDPVKQGIRRTASVTIWKGPQEKELLQSNTVSSSAKTSSQDVERKTTVSRPLMSKIVARPASSFNTRLIQKSKSIDPCRYSVAKATIDRSIQPKETAEERKARLSEWKASKRKMLKRPPSSGVTQSEPEGRNEKSSGSFWTTMVEEDEQRLFTEKVNKTFSECLNLINEPIEEMRHVIADILTMKSQEKVKYGENVEACATKEYIQDVSSEDICVNLESGKPETEKKPRNVVFQDDEKEQDDKTKYLTNDVKTPSAETGGSCLIKYNVSTTPYLQSIKKKIQFDNTDSTFKELKFLTPVRRSQRIQEKTSKLPDMLKDHYPCVSSLEQLTELGGETDAFVCRPNTALCPMYSETGTAQEK